MPEHAEYDVELSNDQKMEKETDLTESILARASDLTQHLDHQTNILIGLSTAIFVFTATGFDPNDINIPMLIMALFSAGSSLLGLFAIHPPQFMRKRGQKESLLYNKKIASFKNGEEYAQALRAATKNGSMTFDQYAIEIYNVCRYAYRPKRRLFHAARRILFIGIALSLFAFMVALATGTWHHLPKF